MGLCHPFDPPNATLILESLPYWYRRIIKSRVIVKNSNLSSQEKGGFLHSDASLEGNFCIYDARPVNENELHFKWRPTPPKDKVIGLGAPVRSED